MRHQVYGRHLGRTSAHRRALKRNLASSLFEHGTIATTPQKAKFVKPFAEKMITLAKQGTLHARRQVIAHLQNRNICQDENGVSVKTGTVIGKLFDEIAPRFSQRSGGYTRIIRLPLRRIGDNGQLVFLQLVDEKVSASTLQASAPVEETPATVAEDATETSETTQVVEKAETPLQETEPSKSDSESTEDGDSNDKS